MQQASRDEAPPVRVGDVLAGKYRVERVLGVGGMGIVVAATHVELGQRVAIKFLLPAALASAVTVGRFAQEARAVVRLRSEHVARVLDVGKLETGAPYIVMEYLEGIDLGTLLEKRAKLDVAEAVDHLLQACEAVAEAHAIGIVHRDLKPRNLFLTFRVDGKPLVKVLDFGISKSMGGPESQSGQQLQLTKTSDIMGSPMYMSPEQLRSSRRADERSDVWSLGVILFELLTGALPFDAESVTELCAVVMHDPPRPIAQLRADVPLELVAAVERCLQKNADERFQSVAALATAIEPFGSQDTRGYGERVRVIAAGTVPRSLPGPQAAPQAAPGSVPSSRVAVTGGTSVSWGETQLAPGIRKQRTIAWTAGVSGGVAIVAAAVIAAMLRDPAPTPGAATATSTTTAMTIGSTTTTTATVAATATTPATTPVRATAAPRNSATGATRPPPSASTSPPARPPSSAPAIAHPPRHDELPNERE